MEPCMEVQVTAPYSVTQPCHVLSEVVTLWSVFDPLWKTLCFFFFSAWSMRRAQRLTTVWQLVVQRAFEFFLASGPKRIWFRPCFCAAVWWFSHPPLQASLILRFVEERRLCVSLHMAGGSVLLRGKWGEDVCVWDGARRPLQPSWRVDGYLLYELVSQVLLLLRKL